MNMKARSMRLRVEGAGLVVVLMPAVLFLAGGVEAQTFTEDWSGSS